MATLLEDHAADMEAKQKAVQAEREHVNLELASLRRLAVRIGKVQQLASPDTLLTVSTALLDEVRNVLQPLKSQRPNLDAGFLPFSVDAIMRAIKAIPFTTAASRSEAETLILARFLATELISPHTAGVTVD